MTDPTQMPSYPEVKPNKDSRPLPAPEKESMSEQQKHDKAATEFMLKLREAAQSHDKLVESIRAEHREELQPRIGMLRQWLNEERIKDAKRFVTNEDIEHWLYK